MPDIHAQQPMSPSVAPCISPNRTPSYTLNLVLVLFIMFKSVSQSTICRTRLKWNLASCSITFLPLFDNTAAFSSICGVDNLFTGPTRNFAMINRHHQQPSNIRHKPIGEVAAITEYHQPGLTHSVERSKTPWQIQLF